MKGAHVRTEGEKLAQIAKRDRRYANSIGKGYCELYRGGSMCPDRSVKKLAGVYVCQHHIDLLEQIRKDAAKQQRRRHPISRVAPRRVA